MSTPFELPPGTEPFTHKVERLAFEAVSGGTRRLTRIESVAHVDQMLAVKANLPTHEVVLSERYDHKDSPRDVERIRMAPEEARHIAACLIEAAEVIERSPGQLGGGDQ